jgi:hypothetical protein
MSDSAPIPLPPVSSFDPSLPEPNEPLFRGYLLLCQVGDASEEDDLPLALAGTPDYSRCRPMMEVVKKDGFNAVGKWKVSKLVADHNHELEVYFIG